MDKEIVANNPARKGFVLPSSFYQTWVITGGAYMFAGACPCCGSQACPVGLGTATLIGGGVAGVGYAVSSLKKAIKKGTFDEQTSS